MIFLAHEDTDTETQASDRYTVNIEAVKTP